MASSTPLQGMELISCAKANARHGLSEASKHCGYGDNLELFSQKLQETCHRIGVEIDSLEDLITTQETAKNRGGVEISPSETDSQAI